jgi:hypothetical protein
MISNEKVVNTKVVRLVEQKTLPFGSSQSEVSCNLQVERTLSDVEAKMSGQVRKKVVQKCFRELDELVTVRPNLSCQDELGWKSAKHESSSFFEANNFGHYAIDLRSCLKTGLQSTGKFLTEQFWKVRTHPFNSTQTRVLDVNPALFLARDGEVHLPLIYVRGDG